MYGNCKLEGIKREVAVLRLKILSRNSSETKTESRILWIKQRKRGLVSPWYKPDALQHNGSSSAVLESSFFRLWFCPFEKYVVSLIRQSRWPRIREVKLDVGVRGMCHVLTETNDSRSCHSDVCIPPPTTVLPSLCFAPPLPLQICFCISRFICLTTDGGLRCVLIYRNWHAKWIFPLQVVRVLLGSYALGKARARKCPGLV